MAKTPPEAPLVTFFMILEGFWHRFRPHFEGFSMTLGIASMTLGIASYITFWYSPKSPDTRNNAKLLQRSCQRLLKKRTGKTLAENLQKTSKNLPKKTKNLQSTSKQPAKSEFPNSQTAYCILRRDSNRNKRRAPK